MTLKKETAIRAATVESWSSRVRLKAYELPLEQVDILKERLFEVVVNFPARNSVSHRNSTAAIGGDLQRRLVGSMQAFGEELLNTNKTTKETRNSTTTSRPSSIITTTLRP